MSDPTIPDLTGECSLPTRAPRPELWFVIGYQIFASGTNYWCVRGPYVDREYAEAVAQEGWIHDPVLVRVPGEGLEEDKP